ncbi:MAG TPA: response regulator [Polyangiaceae bacterium]|nr:response regulator [Polyangiaceae bacterium]
MRSPVDILLVDDEPRNLDALEAILSDPGYRLLRAEDADVALRLLLDHDVAAIVLDIKMPGVSGFDLARIIKNTKRFRETPIVFLTAYMVDDQDVIAGYGAGGVDYLTKPVNPQILRHKVAVFADLFRKTRELADVNQKLARLNERLEERVRERTADLERSEVALRAAAHQKDEFLAVLAHELRNPLAPLRTGLDLLLRFESNPPPPVARTLGAMNRQLDHIVRLIDDLLDVSRISRGLLELKREHVDLAAVIRSTIDSVRPWFERRNQALSLELPEHLDSYADQTRIAQIVTNLLHNAAKFTPPGGSVRVELARDADAAVLRVVDSGAGILAEQLERVFDMFSRIARQGAAAEPGLGIGLALARRLAEMHGGTLKAFSEGEGRGTTFTLRIPLATDSKDQLESAVANRIEKMEGASPLDIVVVEDNEDIADGLLDWLESLGHRVAVARTGRGGVELIRERFPDLVLCDLGLPELDGLDVCRHVRAFPAESQPIMVALTGWGREDDLQRTKEAGFDHHLVKPVAPDKLEALLERVGGERARSVANTKAV